MSEIKTIITNKQGQKVFSRNFTIEPFLLSRFPEEFERFCIVIISPGMTSYVKNLTTYLLGSFIKTDSLNIAKSLNSLKKGQLGMFDLCGKFADIAGQCRDGIMPDWLLNKNIRELISPQSLLKKDRDMPCYTIWFSDSIKNVPACLFDNSNLCFFLDNNEAINYLTGRLGAIKLNLNSSVFVVASGQYQDVKFMSMDLLE